MEFGGSRESPAFEPEEPALLRYVGLDGLSLHRVYLATTATALSFFKIGGGQYLIIMGVHFHGLVSGQVMCATSMQVPLAVNKSEAVISISASSSEREKARKEITAFDTSCTLATTTY